MQTVETAHHIIESSAWEPPRYACKGPCKKVWWRQEIEDAPAAATQACPQCGGSLKTAAEHIDYKVLSNEPGQFKIGNATIGSRSRVKPELIEKAKQEWV